MDTLILGYRSVPAIAFEAESVPYHYYLPAGAKGDTAYILADLIGPKAALKLTDTLLAPGDHTDLAVTIEISGALLSGQRIRSNKAVYPIFVFNGGFAGCPAGVRQVPNGPCGALGGQDSVAACCDSPAFTTSDFCK